MTAAKSTADTLRVLRQNAVQEQEIELLNILQRTLSGMSTLLNNLLDLSKLEAGKMTMKRAAIQVDRLARDILAYFRPEANLKQVFLGTDIGEPLPLVYADPIRIEQVLSNLISNALKHTPEQGQVEVGVHPLTDGGGVRISVKDTGKGIAPENLPRLFDRFYQVSQRGGAGELGTGLGLSLSQQIARLHGSAIEVESKLGQGSHFYFSLRPFSYRLHLSESFKEAVNNLSKEDPDLTLAVVKVSVGKNGAGEAELEKALQKILRRPSDFASRIEAQKCLVVFAYAPERGMRKILSRIREVFKKNFSAEIRSAAARFPADGGRCEDLVDRCLKKLRLKPLQKTGG
ncbi:MAG: hypothetical protein A3G41_08790 [Elusimicrobia bacterium RIFCSPLOWO2_12_FULL_59_9]|nr:MAG: hypothetical protein A3G41_08790 [Elusimicrobia bacterium RIFCSPLOWO2_12_FULL_59_9]